MAPFPGLTQPKIPVNVEENVTGYYLTNEERRTLKEKEAAAAKEVRQQLYQQHFGPKKAGRRTRARKTRVKAKAKGKSRRRK